MLVKDGMKDGRRRVHFRLPAEVQAERVVVAGDFNEWSTESHPLERSTDGGWGRAIDLAPGRYRFRYLVDGARWENDWAADGYEPNVHGGDDSVVVVPGADGEHRDATGAAGDPGDQGYSVERIGRDAIEYWTDDADAPAATEGDRSMPPPPNA